MDTDRYDVVVVGGGAAGLSAALVLGRARRRVAVVDSGAPRNAPAAHMHGFLTRDGIPPADLLAAGRAEVAAYGVELIAGRVVSIEPGLVVRLADGNELASRRLLIATGATDEIPPIPELGKRWGKDLLHCPYCHGWEVRDEPLGILGTDAASVEHAQLIRQWTDDLIFFTHAHDLTDVEREQLEARDIRIVDGEVRGIVVDDDQLRGVVLGDGRTVERAALFIRPAMRPCLDGLLAHLDCETDELGFIRVDAVGRTTAPGVWAAGNAANPRAQVITAAGEGSAAAISISADLVDEDVRNARTASGRDRDETTKEPR
jgi:thioredoxin reductase